MFRQPRSRMHRRLEEFLAIVKRELGAEAAELVGPGEATPDGAGWIVARLPEGMAVGARLPAGHDLAAATDRLAVLVDAFRLSLGEAPPSARPARSELLEALQAELHALAREGGARDALVIDARSPVLWGTTETETESARERLVRSAACFRAVTKVRALPAMAGLHRGGHLHEQASVPGFGYVALSFASIYVAVLVYDTPFEELRARRAFTHALPAIERLLVALPPLDPSPIPIAKAAVARARRRRA